MRTCDQQTSILEGRHHNPKPNRWALQTANGLHEHDKCNILLPYKHVQNDEPDEPARALRAAPTASAQSAAMRACTASWRAQMSAMRSSGRQSHLLSKRLPAGVVHWSRAPIKLPVLAPLLLSSTCMLHRQHESNVLCVLHCRSGQCTECSAFHVMRCSVP